MLASPSIWTFNDRCFRRRCGEMADAQDLKSWDRKKSCRFESDHRHQIDIGLCFQCFIEKKQKTISEV
jgi:hypothetical protein